MRVVKEEEILGLEKYEPLRDRYRALVMDHKKPRRLFLGPHMSVLFEDHDTVLMQIQEILRAERISERSAVRFEIDTYNELVPPDGALLATLMIELPYADERERLRREYVGLDRSIALHIGDRRFVAEFDSEGIYGDYMIQGGGWNVRQRVDRLAAFAQDTWHVTDRL
ncbi:MAG: DUF3501 family protein, partial [Deltaproteobacteria bacterium]